MDSFQDFIHRWSQPATIILLVTSVVYGVIWLTHLSAISSANAVTDALQNQTILELQRHRNEDRVSMARVIAVLDALEKRVSRNEKHD
jgi:hypothetical protein